MTGPGPRMLAAGPATDRVLRAARPLLRVVRSVASAVVLIALVLTAPGVAGLLVPTVALAASPEPTPPPGGDPRSAGEGPGFVGAPLVAIGAVVALALVTVVLTLAWLRLTEPRREPRGRSGERR